MRSFALSVGLLLTVVLCQGAAPGVSVEGDRVTVDTDHGRVVIERGVVVRVMNKLTGETLAAGEPGENDTGLSVMNRLRGVGAKAAVTVARDGAGAVVRAALPDGGALRLRVTVDRATQDILIRQQATSPNKGVDSVQWGVAGIDARTSSCIVPGYSGVKLGMATPATSLGFSWPSSWEVQMAVIQGQAGGCWVWAQDTDLRFKVLHWVRQRDRVSLRFATRNFAPFDDLTSVESVEWRLAFYKGDWRVPARRYRDWAEKTWRLTRLARRRPAWVKDIRFVVTMGMQTGVLDELRTRVPPAATLLYIPQWRRDGYDKMYPDYTANDAFKPFVDYAHKLGYRVMPHMNYFGCDPKHEAYARFKQWQMRNPRTGEALWWIPPLDRGRKDVEPRTKFAYINPASKAWRDDLTRRLVEARDRYGFDAMHLDQTLCLYNDANGRIDGMTCIEGNIALHKQLCDAMPEVALSGEGLDEITCRHEAFAQRHAPHAVNHVYGTWSDEFIACAHPISSYFLTPYTWVNGYLGMCNPGNRGLFTAWRRAYESWGVLPTYSRPSLAQLREPTAEAASLLAEAKVWAADGLAPDFDGPWPASVKFRLKGSRGAAGVYERTEGGGSRFVRVADGRREVVYRIVLGRNTVEGGGSIPGWLAFNRQKLFGLDPRTAYTVLEKPRDERAPHITALSRPALVSVPVCDDGKFVLQLDELPSATSYDFVSRAAEAETWIVVGGKREEMGRGGSFRATQDMCGRVRKRAIFAHPPWRVAQDKDQPPVRSVGQFNVTLPAKGSAVLECSVGLRDAVAGRSDGAQFIIEIDGLAVFDVFWKESQWHDVRIPLDKWMGRTVSVAFVTTPGPARDVQFDWAVWGEPCIRFQPAPKPVEVAFVTPRRVRAVLSSDTTAQWRETAESDGLLQYRIQMRMPNRVALLSAEPTTVSLPLDLAATPWTLSATVEGMPARLPIRHVGASRATSTSNQVERQGISAHPPSYGRTSVDYLLRLPKRERITLEFAVGLRDGSRSEGVIFIVEANTREVHRKKLTSPDGWHEAKVDLTEFAGRTLLLSLVVDSDGPYSYDWAAWADPVIR